MMMKKDIFIQKNTIFLLKNKHKRDDIFPTGMVQSLSKKNFVFIKQRRINKLLLAICGGVIGLINGFFGGGGGMVCVPALEKFALLSQKQSHASAIFVILPLSVVSGLVYFANGFVPIDLLFTVGTGVVVGGIIGALLLKKLTSKIIQFVFVLVMFVAGVRLII